MSTARTKGLGLTWFETRGNLIDDMPTMEVQPTTSPDVDDNAETKGFTTQGMVARITSRQEMQNLRLVQNTLRRNRARDYEREFYQAIGIAV